MTPHRAIAFVSGHVTVGVCAYLIGTIALVTVSSTFVSHFTHVFINGIAGASASGHIFIHIGARRGGIDIGVRAGRVGWVPVAFFSYDSSASR